MPVNTTTACRPTTPATLPAILRSSPSRISPPATKAMTAIASPSTSFT